MESSRTEVQRAEAPPPENPEEDLPTSKPSWMTSHSSSTATEDALPFSFVGSGSVDRVAWSASRVRVMSVIETKTFELVMGTLILFNMVLLVIETNANAKCRDGPESSCEVPKPVNIMNMLLLFVYTAEALCRLYAYRVCYFKMAWNLLDMVVVISGLIELSTNNALSLQVLRVFRVLRLLRTVRLVSFFPELSEMVRGFGSAMRVIFWGVVMIFLLLSVWSLLAVQILHPLNTVEHSDPWCADAFSSVEKAILYLFQTLVANENWGVCEVPLVLEHPEAILIFVGALISVQLGFTNLILAVIVETAAQARERDHDRRLRDKKAHEQACLEEWHKVIEGLDKDLSGTISLEELKLGYKTQPKVAKVLSLLDIDWDDLENLFNLMDNDGSGDVSYVEFFHCLRKAHSQDMRMDLMHVKLQLSQIFNMMTKQGGFHRRPSETSSKLGNPTRQHRAFDGPSDMAPQMSEGLDGVALEHKDLARTVRHTSFRASDFGSKDSASKAWGSASRATGSKESCVSFEAEDCLKATGSAPDKDPYICETEAGLKASLDLLRAQLDSRLDELTRAATKNAHTLDALLSVNNVSLSLSEENDVSENEASNSSAGENNMGLVSGRFTPVSEWHGKPRSNPRKPPRRVLSLKKQLSMQSDGPI